MSRSESSWWFADLLAAAVLTVLATLAVLAGFPGPLRILFVMPLLLFLPGYALVSLLFPVAGQDPASLPEIGDRQPSSGLTTEQTTGLDTPGRIVLSVVFSPGLVGLAALVVNFVTSLSAVPLAIATGAAVLGLLSMAAARRRSYPPSERFAPALSRPELPWADEGRYRFRYTPWNARIPNLALLLGALLLTASIGYAAVDPPESPTYTEFRVATENMTAETQTLYDRRLAAGQAQDVGVVLTNHEGTDVEYTVVAVLQRVERTDSNVTVEESTVVGHREVSVAAGAQRRVGVPVRPTMTGDDLRLRLLLYRGDVPDQPSARTAYRSLRLRVVVQSDGAGDLAIAR
jgi:uncharacterized membrane protein